MNKTNWKAISKLVHWVVFCSRIGIRINFPIFASNILVVASVFSITNNIPGNYRTSDEMEVLEDYKFIQKLMGLNPIGGLENIILRVIYSILLLSSDLLISIFFISKIYDDIYRALAALPAIFGFTLLMTTNWYLLITRKRFHSLLDELQDIFNESKSENASSHIFTVVISHDFHVGSKENGEMYIRAEQRTSLATKIIMYGSCAIPVSSLAPFVLATYDWCLGKYTTDSWIYFYSFW